METIVQEQDIKVFYVTASSFPDGIPAATEDIHKIAPLDGRRFYGISRPEGGPIVYRAAAEERVQGEAEQKGLPTLTLKKGKYLSIDIHDYMKDIPSIGCAFRDLLSQPGIDPEGYCVEYYIDDKDMKCMVRLEEVS